MADERLLTDVEILRLDINDKTLAGKDGLEPFRLTAKAQLAKGKERITNLEIALQMANEELSDRAKVDKRNVCLELEEELAQEFYGIFLNDPSNNHLENKEWVLLVEARTRAKDIIAKCKGTGLKLDRPDRIKLLPIICEICGNTKENECDISEGGCVELQDWADQILALFGEKK